MAQDGVEHKGKGQHMDFKITTDLKSSDVDFLTRKINDEAKSQGITEEAYCFGIFIRDDQGEIIAGANGSVIYGAIYTDQLWVHPEHRGQGLGQRLMAEIHRYGQLQGCKMATVATMDFQNAQGFYERLGYVCDYERSGYFNNHTSMFLVKNLR